MDGMFGLQNKSSGNYVNIKLEMSKDPSGMPILDNLLNKEDVERDQEKHHQKFLILIRFNNSGFYRW